MTEDYSKFRWIRTNAPIDSNRTDDIWFLDEDVGWAVNTAGEIVKTEDGFDSYVRQAHFKDNYLRCIAFANSKTGWVGTMDGPIGLDRLFCTRDGGASWNPVTNLPNGAPGRICGLSVVDENTVYAAGTNEPAEPSAVVRTLDGGETWTVFDLRQAAAILVDVHFKNPKEGWVVGGTDVVMHPGRPPERDDTVPVVLHTTDGGTTWRAAPIRGLSPRGEWGWKIQALDDTRMFVALQSFTDGAILISEDAGKTWRRTRINDRQRNSDLQGIGFLDRNRGWVGGWGYTSGTTDGGSNWDDANEVGRRLNRFRFIGKPLRIGFASGDTIYKFTNRPPARAAEAAPTQTRARMLEGHAFVDIPVEVPTGTEQLQLDVWNRFGRHLRRLADEARPSTGSRSIRWDFTDAGGRDAPDGPYIVRVTADDKSVSHLVFQNETRS
jgi:photosystem II stability/assembly factor-like uncharacterized protein